MENAIEMTPPLHKDLFQHDKNVLEFQSKLNIRNRFVYF
jgi:hypothetical protein